MLEKMGEFFDKRLDGYDEHMMTNIESADEFYPFTASCLPLFDSARVLDLGCGTGLELEEYFKLNPTAAVTGIDLARGMLSELERKLSGKNIELILGSYFDVPFGENIYDAAVSVESLHHYTKAEKIPLYKKIYTALVAQGYFILTDYFSLSEEEEENHRRALCRIKDEEGVADTEIYHYDTPLTLAHECEALIEAGFETVTVFHRWGSTFTLKAEK